MLDREKFSCLTRSADVRLLVQIIQKRGESLCLLQGHISIAISMAYRLVLNLYGRRRLGRFESISCLVVGLLNLSGKIGGLRQAMGKLVAQSLYQKRYLESTACIKTIRIDGVEVVLFSEAELTMYRESVPSVLLQTEVVISTLLDFDFAFIDVHAGFGPRLQASDLPASTKKTAWVLLSDMVFCGLGTLFTAEVLMTGAEYIAINLHNYGSKTKDWLPNHTPSGLVLELESELMYVYRNNWLASVGFNRHK
ncbi:hypothetical protein NEHOM01_1940 [Nematocida homosporus]|uniref:uncharacterized protein n=1 Tax=Nematocida homosporus TaxID=1912981 RepID=UPI00221EAA2D|nr:uncharacterized protein NEHOM01_1940 [Nematocida homosporus]KAI5187109.1 hypothetical protein NEHOM01_1940 [Nematocida homosporus]